jgi:hypothetical protein
VWVSLIITTRASKDAILEMYLNDMTLGQRGSFGDRRRAGSVAAVLRQGRQQRDARRSGDDRRRLSSRRPRCRRSTTRTRCRSAATSCCRRWSTPATSRRTRRPRRPRAADRRPARARSRSAVLRRLLSARRSPISTGAHDHRRPRRWTCTRRSICTCSGLAQDAVRDG